MVQKEGDLGWLLVCIVRAWAELWILADAFLAGGLLEDAAYFGKVGVGDGVLKSRPRRLDCFVVNGQTKSVRVFCDKVRSQLRNPIEHIYRSLRLLLYRIDLLRVVLPRPWIHMSLHRLQRLIRVDFLYCLAYRIHERSRAYVCVSLDILQISLYFILARA